MMLDVFFFKQKTGYEMRISEGSSDVCSSEPGADVVGNAEAFAGGGFGEVAVQLGARGEAHGMHDAVQAVPLLAQFFENLGDFFIAGHVAWKAQLRVRAPALCELFDAPLAFVVLISEGKLSALAMHGGDRTGGV